MWFLVLRSGRGGEGSPLGGGENRLLPEHDPPYTDPAGGRMYIFLCYLLVHTSPWAGPCSNGSREDVVNTSIVVGSVALVLAGVIASGHAFGQEIITAPQPTAQEKLDQREALRRAAMQEQQKRKEDFARNCIKPDLSDKQLEACRAAYRKL